MGNVRKEGRRKGGGEEEGVSVSVYMMCDLCIYIHGSGIGLDRYPFYCIFIHPLVRRQSI